MKIFKDFKALILSVISALLVAFLLAIFPISNFNNYEIKVYRVILGFIVLIVLTSIGWVLYYKTKKQLETALKPTHKFADDFVFDSRLSIYTHKTKLGVFCAICVGAEKESPLQVKGHGWQCAHNEKHWFKNPDYIEPPTVRGSFSAWE